MTIVGIAVGAGGYYAFQYRKRYEVTCDNSSHGHILSIIEFQYRKRYEVTCDLEILLVRTIVILFHVSIPQAV